MPRGAAVRQADIERTIRALASCGHRVARIEVAAGGVVRVIPALTAAPGDGVSAFDEWKASQDARRALEGA